MQQKEENVIMMKRARRKRKRGETGNNDGRVGVRNRFRSWASSLLLQWQDHFFLPKICKKFTKSEKKKQLKYCDCLTKKNVFPPTNIQQVIDARLGPGKKNKIKIPFAKLLVRCCLSARSRRGTE